MSIRSRIERLEREFLPQERHGPITSPEFDFIFWCSQRSEAELKAVADASRDGTDYETEFRVKWPDGSVHWLGVRGCTIQPAGDVPAESASRPPNVPATR